jgi:hypothetical protein
VGNLELSGDGFAVSRALASSYSGKDFLKELYCRGYGHVVDSRNVDEEVKKYINSGALRVHSIDGFSKTLSPCFKMETYSDLVVGE